MAPLRILVLLINKPGHRHQAEGMAHVMGRMRETVVERLEVKPRWFVPPPLRQLGVASFRFLPPAFWLKLLYGIDVAALGRPDVILGSGRPAIGVGLLIKRHFGVPYVYSGLGRGVPTTPEIDLMLVSVPSFADEPNAVLTPVPCLVEPDKLPQPRRLDTLADLTGARLGLLLGGHAHSHRFCDEDWDDIATLVTEMRARYGVVWRVGNSRRTGGAGSDRFAELERQGVIERFVDWRRAGSGTVGEIFASDALIVTEDSVAMMAEAVATQRRVVALRPRDYEPTLVDDIVGTLVDGGAMAVMPIAGTRADALAATLLRLAPIATDHRDEIAAALAARLPQLFGDGGDAR